MPILKGKLGAVFGNYAASVAATGEACVLDSGFTYKITDITKRYWDKAQTVTVYENAVESTKAYTLEYPGGRIVFPSAPTTPVTVDCYYYRLARAAGFQNWGIDNVGMEMVDVTEFGDLWRNHETLLGEFSASADRYWVSEFYPDAVIDGTLQLMFAFYEKLDITQLMNPWTIGNFELDDDANGIANGWAAHVSGTPIGSRSLVSSGAFAGAKFQRINVTAIEPNEEYGVASSGLGNAAAGDQVAIQLRYKTSGTDAFIGARAKIGSTGNVITMAAATDWTVINVVRKYSGTDDMNLYVYFLGTGSFSEDADLDVDWVRIYHLPTSNAQKRWEGYGRLPTVDISAPVGDLVREALSIEGDGPLYYRTDEVSLGGQTS